MIQIPSITNNSLPPLIQIPQGSTTEQTYNRAVSLFSIILGAYSRVVNSSIGELYDMISERKDLFRHTIKFNLNKAMNTSDELVKAFMNMADTKEGISLWVDVTTAIEHSVLKDINILFLTVDNILLKYGIKDDKIEAQQIVAYNLSTMMLDVFDSFCKTMRQFGVILRSPIFDLHFEKKMSGICMAMHAISQILVPEAHAEYLKEGGLIVRGLEVIATKIANIDYIEEATNKVLENNGVSLDDENQKNAYTPWTTIQDNLLRKYYCSSVLSIEELALLTGRSEGAVKRRVSRLGLIKQ